MHLPPRGRAAGDLQTQVALFFAAFREEAEKYIEDEAEYEREEEQRMENHCAALRSYVKSPPKKELREQLFAALAELGGQGRSFYYWAFSRKNISR